MLKKWFIIALLGSLQTWSFGLSENIITELQQLRIDISKATTEDRAEKIEKLKSKITEAKLVLQDQTEIKELTGLKSPGEDAIAKAKRQLRSEIEEAQKALNEEKINKLDELIGNVSPMTAVLFSPGLNRNSFEVINPSGESDATLGEISQSGGGETAGVLLAAEAPFSFWKTEELRIPVGAWFGVNFQTGGGETLNNVDLATGISLTFIPESRVENAKKEGGFGLAKTARVLLGIIYGEKETLGGKELTIGKPFPIGGTLPLVKERSLQFTFGLGFRF